VEAMLVDLDGDGLPDRLRNASEPGDGICKAHWQSNHGPETDRTLKSFGAQDEHTIALPRLRWNGTPDYLFGNPSLPPTGRSTPDPINDHLEACTLNGQ